MGPEMAANLCISIYVIVSIESTFQRFSTIDTGFRNSPMVCKTIQKKVGILTPQQRRRTHQKLSKCNFRVSKLEKPMGHGSWAEGRVTEAEKETTSRRSPRALPKVVVAAAAH